MAKYEINPQVKQMNNKRLGFWEMDLNERNLTAMVVIGTGTTDAGTLGNQSIHCPSGISRTQLSAYLRGIADAVERGTIKIN